MVETVINLLSFLTLVSNIVVAVVIFLFLLKLVGVWVVGWQKVEGVLREKGLAFAFIVSLTAVFGSLFMSEVAGLTPCKLCWFQRIFMYPLPFVLGVSIFQKKRDVFHYAKPLSVIGLGIAIYHYYLQLSPQPLAPCTTVGFSISCSSRFVTHFGYITIPFMSLSAFLIVFLLVIFNIYGKK